MEIIIDTSAILAVLLNEPQKDSIIESTKGCVILTPACIEYEIGNAVSAMFKRRLITVSEGVLLWHEFSKIPLRQIPAPIHDAIILAGAESIYAYDAYYLACAEQMRLPLLTLDAQMKSIALKREIQCLEV